MQQWWDLSRIFCISLYWAVISAFHFLFTLLPFPTLMLHCTTNAAITLSVFLLVLFCSSLTVAIYFTSPVPCVVYVAIIFSFSICCHTFFTLLTRPRSNPVAFIPLQEFCLGFFASSTSSTLFRPYFIFTIPFLSFLYCHFFIAVFRRHFSRIADESPLGYHYFFFAVSLSPIFCHHSSVAILPMRFSRHFVVTVSSLVFFLALFHYSFIVSMILSQSHSCQYFVAHFQLVFFHRRVLISLSFCHLLVSSS